MERRDGHFIITTSTRYKMCVTSSSAITVQLSRKRHKNVGDGNRVEKMETHSLRRNLERRKKKKNVYFSDISRLTGGVSRADNIPRVYKYKLFAGRRRHALRAAKKARKDRQKQSLFRSRAILFPCFCPRSLLLLSLPLLLRGPQKRVRFRVINACFTSCRNG